MFYKDMRIYHSCPKALIRANIATEKYQRFGESWADLNFWDVENHVCRDILACDGPPKTRKSNHTYCSGRDLQRSPLNFRFLTTSHYKRRMQEIRFVEFMNVLNLPKLCFGWNLFAPGRFLLQMPTALRVSRRMDSLLRIHFWSCASLSRLFYMLKQTASLCRVAIAGWHGFLSQTSVCGCFLTELHNSYFANISFAVAKSYERKENLSKICSLSTTKWCCVFENFHF